MKKLLMLQAALCFVFFSCASTNPAGQSPHHPSSKKPIKRPQTTVSDLDWDFSVGAKAYDETLINLEQNGVPVDNERNVAMEKRLDGIMKKLAGKTLLPSLPFEVHLLDHETANAACYPGGRIVFFTGIFDLHEDGFVDPNDEDEIAAVMAHEMAHGSLRHSYRTFKSVRNVLILREILAAAGSYIGGDLWAGVASIGFNLIAGVYFPKYSRDHESEADLESIYLMIAAGYRSEAILEIWERAYRRGGDYAKGTGVYSSHPSNRRRLEVLTKQIAFIKNSLDKG